ncbi:hypothetical protein [Psychrobacillus vulpis]|uniref:Uncharacterized protein n=1 Tax=Psychrobacillus vulpis TaxID=2325572 RepID=A0A544TVI6_9BACI|nr:hypothetical protein [Psychrobacillus vulpis]TQR21444.1 hypothetical protein FG384_00310 [Psychrobacillus vulpis]
MNNWMLLPLLGTLFIAWLIFRVAKSVSKRINWNQRLNKWTISTYVGILLLAVIVYEFIPANGDEVIDKKEYQALSHENNLFEKAFGNNEESKFDSKFLVEEWMEELEGDTLEIISQGSTFPTAKLNIEWTDSKEQFVEVKMFQTNILMNGVNVTGKIPLSTIEWEKDQLVITAPKAGELRYYRFSNELFALSIGDDIIQNRGIFGDTYIYLKVPKHINVIDKNGLQFY